MDIDFSPEQLIQYFDTGLLIFFFVIIGVFVLGFLRGLRQGWKYGTYRFIFFAILIAAAYFLTKSLANAVATFNLSSFNISPIDFDLEVNDTVVNITSPVTNIKDTGTNILTQIFQAFNVSADPETVAGLVLAIVVSFATIIALMLEAIVIALVGNLLCLILWHVLFKHFIPVEARKKKNLKVISGFEQAVTSVVVLAMFISPLTGMLNNLNRSFERLPKDQETSNKIVLDSESYQTITGLLDTYDNSIFNKVFFSWYAGDANGMRFDEALLTYISTVDLPSGEKFSIVSELSNVIKGASYIVDGGLLSDDGVDGDAAALFATSQYAPKLLRVIGQSKLVQEIAPIAFNVLFNLDEIADFIITEEGIDVSHYDHALTFNKLADLYQSIIDSGVLTELVDESTGEFTFDAQHVSNIFAPGYQATFDNIFETLGSSELEFLNDVIASAIYVQAVKEYKLMEESSEGDIVIGVKDILPELSEEELKCSPNGRPVAIPDSIKNINFAGELQIVFDTIYELINIDEDFLPLILDPLLNEESGGFDDDTINGLISIVLDNVDDVEKYIDGHGLESGKNCLLDSTLIANAIPTFLKLIESSTNELIGLDDSEAMSLESIITDYKAKDLSAKKEAAKEETKNLLGILRPFVQSEEGKALIKDLEHLPGLYFDKSGMFMGAKEGLLDALAEGLKNIDNSKIFSNILPAILNKFIGGENGMLKQGLGLDLKLDLSPKNASGESILGHEISKIIQTYAVCQESITYLMGAFGSSSDLKAMEKAFSTVCNFKTPSGENQLVKLLTAIGQSKIFNPITYDHGVAIYNNSVFELFKMIFNATGFFNAEMENDIKDIILVETFDVESEISGLVGLIKHLADNHILGTFSGGISLETMSEISFHDLFAKVSQSELLQTIIADIIDTNLGSNPIFQYVDEGDVTVQLSFKDIHDWEKEGSALDSMTKYAYLIGDISSISFESIDPEMISSLFGFLSNSQLFVTANEDGTSNWLLPRYLANKVVKIAKTSGDMGQFFTDIEETYEGGVYKAEGKNPTLDESYSALKADILAFDIQQTNDMSLITDGQATFMEEGQKLAEIIRCLASAGAMNLITGGVDANYANFKVPYFATLMDKMSESIFMGRTGIAQILSVVANMLKDYVEPFGYANVMFAFETNSVAERKAVANAIVTILECSLDPVTGFLGADSKIDLGKLAHMEELDPNHFVSPILHALNSSEAFTTLSTFQQTTAGMTKTTFLAEISSALKSASWYGSVSNIEAMLPIIDADVIAHGGWDIEIDNFVKALDDFNIMGLSTSGSFSLDGFFKEEKYGEDVVAKALLDINHSRLLYPGFPAKLDDAISSMQSGSLAGSGISLDNANTFYSGKALAGTYAYSTKPFDDDECYRLASIIGKSSTLGSIDLSDLSTLSSEDVDNVTSLLADFAQSGIFNTLKQGSSSSVFQDVMGAVLGGDSLKDYYISNTSPKDLANASHYATAVEKAKYFANLEYPYISNTNSNADVTNLKDPSDPSSLRSLLNLLTSDNDLIDALANGALDSLSETKMGLVLDALNKCDWTYDIVPNALADSIKNQTLDAVELKRSNPYYQYSYSIVLNGDSYENSGMLLGTPNYENRYDDNEIELVAHAVSTVISNPTLTTDLSSKAKVLELRNFLETLNDSYSFHLAGASYVLQADDNLSEYTLTDPPVFEQAMYSLYKQSGLAALAYNEVYDGEYATYEAKLLDKIKDYPDNKWSEELVNLIINDTMDKGLFSVAFDLGLISGGNVSLSSSEIIGKNPTDLSKILYSANKVDITQELVAYEIQKALEDTINFKVYSKETATYDVNANSFVVDLDNAVYTLQINMTSGPAPTVSYAKAGSTYSVTPTGSNPYTYVLHNGTTITDRPIAKDIQISGSGVIDEVKVTFTADKEIGLTQAQYDTEIAGNHVGAIKELMNIAEDCFYDEVNEVYIDLATDENALANIFNTTGSVTSIFKFLKSPNSYFTESFDSSFNKNGSDFDAGDISMSRMLGFKYLTYNVDLFEYMPDYNAVNRVPGYINLHEIASMGTPEAVASWLDGHILEAGVFYGAYKALPNIQAVATYVPSLAFSGENIATYLYNDAEWNTFEAAFKTGFARKMYVDMRNEAILSAHFPGNITPSSLYEPNASNFQGFISLTRGTLIPLLKDLQITGLSNTTIAATRLDGLANTAIDSPYKDVISSYYEKAIYEALLANMSASFLAQPSTHGTPFGAGGYLRNAAIILEPSLA